MEFHYNLVKMIVRQLDKGLGADPYQVAQYGALDWEVEMCLNAGTILRLSNGRYRVAGGAKCTRT